MAKEILKRLIYSFLVTLAVSMPYLWWRYDGARGNEERQATFILVVVSFILCVLNFVLSLTALLNVYPGIRQNFWKSLLAFIGVPGLLFIGLVMLFLVSRNETETIGDFLEIGHISIVFIAVLTFHFFRFRNQIHEAFL